MKEMGRLLLEVMECLVVNSSVPLPTGKKLNE